MEREVHAEVKKTILENLKKVEFGYFTLVDGNDLKLAQIATSIEIGDISVSMWGAVKKCYYLLTDGNKDFNNTAVEICSRIVKKECSGKGIRRGTVLETVN